jgi:hypothetical protein
MLIATRMRPELRVRIIGELFLQWEHDGLLVDSFTVSLNGTEYDLGPLTPFTGTTYREAVPFGILPSVEYQVVVYAVNENGRSESIEALITW